MTQLILDAAYPPAGPFDWLGVLRAAGATGSMLYIFDPYINPNRWSPAYAASLQAAGIGILPVYVTFDQPIGHARQVMAGYGWGPGHNYPVIGDIEQGSFPSEATFDAWCQDLRANGYTSVAYGTASTLDTYRKYADRAILASYRALHTVAPVPSLDGVSYDGWQYSDQIFINGVEIDASVTSIPLISGAQEDDMYSDDDRARDQRVLGLLSQGQQFDLQGNPIPGAPRWIPQVLEDVRTDQASQDAALTALKAELDAMKAEVEAIKIKGLSGTISGTINAE